MSSKNNFSAKGYVYFILNQSNQQVKIGFTRSKDINKRLKQLQVGNGDELKVIYYVEGTMDTEKYYHRKFNLDGVIGEWFNYSYGIKHEIMCLKYLEKEKQNKL